MMKYIAVYTETIEFYRFIYILFMYIDTVHSNHIKVINMEIVWMCNLKYLVFTLYEHKMKDC